MTKAFDRQLILLKFTTRQLVDELSKRKGITKRIEAECIVNDSGCLYQEYSDCADCMKEHGVVMLVIKK
jgi:hypothetical protein